MPHSLPQIAVEKDTYARFNMCVHCGLCLPACPTYVETLNEADSPRGRIHLMRAVVDRRLMPSRVVLDHLDACLVCRACETACPSGVVYHDIIETVRPQVAHAVQGRPLRSRVLAWMIRHVLPYPRRAALAMLPLRVARMIGLGGVARSVARLMPSPLGDMAEVVPASPLIGPAIPAFTRADTTHGPRQGSVVLLLGCVGSAVSGTLNKACVEVLARNGYDVHTLAYEPCCGALAAHANDPDRAKEFARQTVDALSTRTDDYFVSPIAGCGAHLKALHEVLDESETYRTPAGRVASRVVDICELLAASRLRGTLGRIDRVVTYHDPCHLVHAQRVSGAPRSLLGQIPGVTLVALGESEICCGAAGTYNLSQPQMAAALGRRKVANIVATGAETCATANVGCELQINRHVARQGCAVSVAHVIELLAESYRLGSTGRKLS